MLLTNKYGLPSLLVKAIANDTYSSGRLPEHGDRYITVTQLIRPPQLNRLAWKHADRIVEDASERIWSLLGQSVHTIIERASINSPELISEQRMYGEIGGWTLGGQIDLYEPARCVLWDFKVTSVFSADDDMKVDWERQLNLLVWLLARNGHPVESANICGILRDWSRTKAKFGKNTGYPRLPAKLIPARLWSPEEAEVFILGRLAEIEADEPRACTDDERWAQGGKWAALKKGNKRARLFGSYEEAVKFAESQAPHEYTIEGREAEYRRCEDYCPVRAFCRQAHGDANVNA